MRKNYDKIRKNYDKMGKKPFKFSPKACQKARATREREREVPHPNTAPFSLYLKALYYDDTKRLHNLLAKFTLFEFKKSIFEF